MPPTTYVHILLGKDVRINMFSPHITKWLVHYSVCEVRNGDTGCVCINQLPIDSDI